MTPADKLLAHFDRMTGSEPQFVRVSDDEDSPAVHAAIYHDSPKRGVLTGFTVGLSHFHPPGGSHKELTISMRGQDDEWALACGYLAFQLREQCPFVCGDTINFHEQIAPTSSMSAFLALHPLWINDRDAVVDIGVRRIEIVQLVPLYESERSWLSDGGDVNSFLKANTASALMNPRRKPFIPT